MRTRSALFRCSAENQEKKFVNTSINNITKKHALTFIEKCKTFYPSLQKSGWMLNQEI